MIFEVEPSAVLCSSLGHTGFHQGHYVAFVAHAYNSDLLQKKKNMN